MDIEKLPKNIDCFVHHSFEYVVQMVMIWLVSAVSGTKLKITFIVQWNVFYVHGV